MLKKAIKKVVRQTLNLYPERVCRQEYESQSFTRFNERPIEFSFVFRKIGELYPTTILDVGTGNTALPHLMRNCGCLVTATDNVTDYWPAGMSNRHYHVIDDDITSTNLKDAFDLVTCVSVLEHIQEPDKAIKNMFSLLKNGGYLVLTCPFSESEYVKNVYELPDSSYGKGSPYITQSYSRNDVDRWLSDNQASLEEQEYWQFWEGDRWTQGAQIIPPRKSSAGAKHQHTCILLKKTEKYKLDAAN